MVFDEFPIQRRSSQTPPPDNRGGRARLLLLMAGVLVVFVALSGRLFVLQTVQRGQFEQRAVARQLDTRFQTATRGLIYDRTGIPLVRNAPSYQIAIVPVEQYVEPVPDGATVEQITQASIAQRLRRAEVYNRLATLIGRPEVTAGEIFTRVVRAGRTFDPVVVAENIPRDQALVIQEQSLLMPGVVVQSVGSRIYPYGELLSKALGYTGKIQAETVDQRGLTQSNVSNRIYYRDPTGSYLYDVDQDRIGVAGLEAFLERELRGVKGEEEALRDASLEKIRTTRETSPTAGNNVRLTIDLRLQTIISEALSFGLREQGSPRGAVVAMNPNTGEILGMLSFPSYDNNLFAQGITADQFNVITSNIHKPLINHAVQETVSPGSTFKIVTTAAILQETGDNVDEFTVIDDPGIFEVPSDFEGGAAQKFYCWIGLNGGRHGPQRAEDALKNSCDTYYYRAVGGYRPDNIRGIGSDALSAWARAFGIGEGSFNLGIPYKPGYPASYSENLKRAGGIWTLGDDYNVAIGQGKMEASPLEMAMVTSVIANGGTLYEPRLVRDVINTQNQIVIPFEPRVIRKVPLDERYMQLIQRSLWRVVNDETGTAYRSTLRTWNFEYAGKTGTAEYCDDIALRARRCPPDTEFKPTHAWFTAYAPAENPQLVLSVYVWDGGQGSGTAAPIAQRIIARYFDVEVPEADLAPILKTTSE
jgi:penicillin-binding protein 2